MPEIRLFVEPAAAISKRCQISSSVAQELGVSSGSIVRLVDPDNNSVSTNCPVDIVDDVLDFSIKVASDILTEINYAGIEFIIELAGGIPQPSPDQVQKPVAPVSPQPSISTTPQSQMGVSPPSGVPQPGQMPGISQPGQVPQPQMGVPPPSGVPQPGQMPGISQPGQVPQPQMGVPPPSGVPQPGQMPGMPQPGQVPQPQMGVPPPSGVPQPGQMPGMPQPLQVPQSQMGMQPQMGIQPQNNAAPAMAAPDPYPNKIEPSMLASQKPGSLVLTIAKVPFAESRAKLNSQTIQNFGLTQGMLVGWECPLTRSKGSARISIDNSVPANSIKLGVDTIEDTGIKSEQIVVYSTEPPIVHQDVLTLEVVSQADLNGNILVNPRNAATLQVQPGDVIAFEDNLTGAVGAAKFQIKEDLTNDQVLIDSELLEASGIGSMEVDVKKNMRQIIPLQSIELGIAPIKGEDVWSIISMARQNIASIKTWLSNYIIFKGIKLRWEAANVGCEVLNTTPDLVGDVFAQITPNTTLTLKPTGLVTFNAILIIDISRSMMARDVEVKNIGPALEGIKAAMHAPEIKDFLKKFKPGILVPRRYSAAFGAILFLSEKVGRGFGEKVSIIRFADEAQALQFRGGKPYMDSSAGEKDVLEQAAKLIVDQIGNAYGQATNMGVAMLKAQELLYSFGDEMPTMIVLLTDGVPTDGDQFYQAVQAFSVNPNVVMYIIGLGNPDDAAMKRAAALCGGEYFKPNDSGELLIWYSKRARDLQVKLKANK